MEIIGDKLTFIMESNLEKKKEKKIKSKYFIKFYIEGIKFRDISY